MAVKLLSNFMSRGHSPIGVDIGHEAIKLLQLRREGEGWAVSASGLHVFGEEVRQGPGLRWRYAAQAIESLLKCPGRTRFTGNRVVACLDSETVMVKNARLPAMPDEEMAEAVHWEAADRFPFDITNGLVRYLVAGEVRQGAEQRQEVLMFAVSDDALRDQLRVLEQAGCRPVGLDTQAVALGRAMEYFAPCGPGGETVRAVVDLGGQSSQMTIFRDGRIVFVKNIEVGSNAMTRAVVEKVGTSFEDTAALRMKLGQPRPAGESAGAGAVLGEDSKVSRAVTAAMRPVAERLAQEITLCLRYYSVTFRGQRPDRVIFVGGACHDRLLIRLLEEGLGIEAQVARPLAACHADWDTCQWGEGPAAGGPEWAVALGCCLKPAVRGTGPAAGEARAGGARPAAAAGPPVSAEGEPELSDMTVGSGTKP